MSSTQWLMLVFGALAVVAFYVMFRRPARPSASRPRQAPQTGAPQAGAAAGGSTPEAAQTKDQLDMFSRFGEFDELGVGKPRKLSVPGAQAETPPVATGGAIEEKLVVLLIAEREGTAILGPKIHTALRDHGLLFGDKTVYHRMAGGRPVFSVASLVKPGVLDPAEQRTFSTPGLSLFMVLPGPEAPAQAIAGMLSTARSLASQLNAEVYDGSRNPLTPAAEKALTDEVLAWARKHRL